MGWPSTLWSLQGQVTTPDWRSTWDQRRRSTRIGKRPVAGVGDWKEIQMACADIAPSVALAFPVRRINNDLPACSPVNPKDVQAVIKAIAEKEINSAMVSTLIDNVFSNDYMLPFDIKQTCRMIFDGAGMIIFKQEWEDNCLNMLTRVTGDHHPPRNFSLQRLMGNDPNVVSPQAQAQSLRASEVAATTCAAREAIHAACRIVSKPAPWTTIRQSESESFTKFVDRLQATVDASDLPAEAKGPVMASCLRQQCNQATKEILRSVQPGAGITAMIKHVAREENLATVQAAVGAALAPIPAAVSAAVAKGDKFTLRATVTYPSPPIKLTWKSSDPVCVEQWPIPEPRMSILLELVQ
ncbi:hypothetical protein TURU_169369 [Turdus rufiventris]|nr:hypothetical protein TURU_169369 [Turdus rufiventris]